MIALTALALAGRPLSAHVLAWCVSRGLQVHPGGVFIVTMTPIALGATVAGATIRLVPEITQAGTHVLIGLSLGGLLILIEWSLAQCVRPKSQPTQEATDIDTQLHTDPTIVEAGGIARIYRNWSIPHKMMVARPWGLPELCLVAILEEILYRGIIGFTALSSEISAASIGLLVISAVLFGLSHDTFGAYQILLKTAYAAILTEATLLAGSLLPAFIGHLVLNVFSWAQSKRWMRAVQAQQEQGDK